MAKDTQTYREDEGSPEDRHTNGQVRQAAGRDLSPADGGDGFVGSNTGPSLGMKVVSGKKGYSTDRPIWSQESSDGGDMASPEHGNPGTDPTDEKASYKKPQTDEGLPQTYRTSAGAGDAGPSGSDDGEEMTGQTDLHGRPDTQDFSESEMPQTEFTHNDGGGAPRFKHGA